MSITPGSVPTSQKNIVLEPGSLVVVSGANGNIASHVVDALLAAGYRVRGTVRSIEKSSWLLDQFGKKYGKDKIELIEVPDMAAPGAFDEAVKGASGFIQTATPVMESEDPNKAIPMVVEGVKHVLAACHKEPSVMRVVITSSSGACTAPYPGVKFHIDSKTWNDQAVKDAWLPPPYEGLQRKLDVYYASKTESERAAWAFLKENKPSFVLNTILPNANFGPVVNAEHQAYHSTLGWIKAVWESFEGQEELKDQPPQYYINIVDDAMVHVAALIYGDVKSERLFTFAFPYNWNDILAIMRKLAPEKKFMGDIPDLGRDLSTVTNERAEDLLERFAGHGWTDLETTVKQSLKDYA